MAEGPGVVTADPTVYALRANAFVKRRIYRLTENAFTWEEEGRPLDGVFLDGISEIRLAYAPTRAATGRYRAQIIFREGGMVELFNTDYRGFLDFAEQNDSYVAFLRELHRRVAATGEAVRYRQGNSVPAYIGNIILTLAIFAGLVAISFFLTVVDLLWLVILKLLIVLSLIPLLVQYMRRAKPGEYDPHAIPDAVLPTVASADIR